MRQQIVDEKFDVEAEVVEVVEAGRSTESDLERSRCAGVCRKRGSYDDGVAVVGDAGGGAAIEGDVWVGRTRAGVDADDADTAGAGVDVDTDADADADAAGDAGCRRRRRRLLLGHLRRKPAAPAVALSYHRRAIVSDQATPKPREKS
ncbi:hypothetical protein FB451DRAFT_1387069 [Mycena latifolia]|nr:hypothetical protein FB451DRAFT_1387069 [Mycena latifolia]